MNWLAKLEKMKKELEDTVSMERRKLLMEQELVSFKLESLGKKIEELAQLEGELETLLADKNILRKKEEDRISLKRVSLDLASRIKKLKESDSLMVSRGKKTELKIKLLEDPEPHCPICLKEMRYDEKIRAKSKLLERDRIEKDLLKRNEEQLKSLVDKAEEIKHKLKDIDRSLMGKSIVFERSEEIRKKIVDIKEEALKFRDLERRSKEIENSLRDKNYAEVAQKVLTEINKEIKDSL
ncbi:hypothetical protein HGB13_03370 [bacterium]|nr:hypothetical protein [bacterium]